MPLSGEGRQLLATLCVNILSCSLGSLMGWASSGMKFLESSACDLVGGRFTPEEAGMINSMYCVGGLIGACAYGYICDKIGRNWAIRTIAFPQVIAYFLVGFAETALMIIISRIFAGLSGGALYICIPLFVSEISEDSIRGTLGTIIILMSSLGLLLSYVLGAFMRYDQVVWVFLVLPIVYFMLSFLLWETPFHLIKSGKLKEAEDSLMFYRGVTMLAGGAEFEFEELKKFVHSDVKEEKISLKNFFTKAARRSIMIGTVLVALEQFSGCFALLFYAESIFEESGTSISPDIATIILGVIQLAGAYTSTFLVDRLGRRILLCSSAFGIAFGMIVFGICTQLIEYGNENAFIKVVPVISLSFSIFVTNIGVFTLTFVVLSEISPSNIKSHIFTFCMILSWVFTFTVFNLLSPMQQMFGLGGVMYIFSFCAILGGTFAIFCIPETMGKSFEEISHIMEQ